MSFSFCFPGLVGKKPDNTAVTGVIRTAETAELTLFIAGVLFCMRDILVKHRKNLIASFFASLTLHGIAVMCIAGFVVAGGSQLVPVFRQGASSIMVTLAESGQSAAPLPEAKPDVRIDVPRPLKMPAIDIPEKPIPAVAGLKSPRPLVPDTNKSVEVTPEDKPVEVAGADSDDSSRRSDETGEKDGDNASKGVQMPADTGSYFDIQCPAYPLGAKLRGEEGLVVVKASVNAKGRAEKVEVLKSSGYAALDESAVNAMKRARFVARNGGSIRAGEVTQPFVYKLVLEGTN